MTSHDHHPAMFTLCADRPYVRCERNLSHSARLPVCARDL